MSAEDGELHLEIVTNAVNVAEELIELGSTVKGLTSEMREAISKAQVFLDALNNVRNGAQEESQGMRELTAQNHAAAEGWAALTKELREYSKEAKEAAQASVVDGHPVNGVDPKGLAAARLLPRSERDGLLEIEDAKNMSPTGALRTANREDDAARAEVEAARLAKLKELAAEEKRLDDARISNTKIVNGLLEEQFRHDQKIAAEQVKIANTGNKDAHVQAFELNNVAIEKRTKEEAIYNNLLAEQLAYDNKIIAAQVKIANTGQKDAHVQAYEQHNASEETRTKQAAMYAQYEYDNNAKLAASRSRADAQEARDSEHALKNETKLNEERRLGTKGIIAQRYAMYDVGSTLGIVAAATLGVAIATERVAIARERAFANVARTAVSPEKGTVGQEAATAVLKKTA